MLWVSVWGIMKVAGGMRATPEKVMEFVEGNPLAEVTDPEERKKVIDKLAHMMNQLEPDEMSRMMDDDEERREERDRRGELLFGNMTEEEQWYFMEKRAGRAIEQMMLVFNAMDPVERKRIVQRTLKDMEQRGNNEDARSRMMEQDPELADKIVNEGLRAYYQKASAETKLDLAPLMEAMQRNVGLGRTGPRHRDRD